MMDYAVSLTATLREPISDGDAFLDELGSSAAISVTGDEVRVSADVTAEDVTAAAATAVQLIVDGATRAGVLVSAVVGVEVLEWARFEAELSTSNLPDLVSSIEVAEILGVSKQRVYQLNHENRLFPPPLLQLGSGPVWLRSTIEAFDRSWSRKRGRPSADELAARESMEAAVQALSGPGTFIGKTRARRTANITAMEKGSRDKR